MHRRAWWRTALSAQPPPTHPITIFPSLSIIALEPGLAEVEPSTRTTVATANDFPWDTNSFDFVRMAIDIRDSPIL
jgi:hypothetical protein